jgi:hypothetical protein
MKHLEEAPLKGKKLLLEMLYSYDYFHFDLVFIKNKVMKLNFLKKKNRFKPVWLGFSVWLGFFRFGSIFSVRFGFFIFKLIKPKPNRTGWFFQNFNRFFFTV